MNKENFIAISYSYLSYLFRDKQIKDKIKRIYLFGSVVRGEADENSDIDIFVDIGKLESSNEKIIKKQCELALKQFYKIEGKKWEYKGITNKFSLKVGNLNEWDLKNSIEREGIVLYSTTSISNLTKYLLFSFEAIKNPKKRIRVVRKLFGRKDQLYKDNGLVGKFSGKVITPRSFFVSSDGLVDITSFFSKEKVKFSFEEIWK